VVDALYAATGTLANSAGSMSNFTFGDAHRQYYETISGGAGAGDGFDGASAVQTHMTNSRLTDPEVLERRFPVRLERFAVRRGSGGAGAHRGGDGVGPPRALSWSRWTSPCSPPAGSIRPRGSPAAAPPCRAPSV
jgi:5-oxoprolinase (ATP-hydrolysing)